MTSYRHYRFCANRAIFLPDLHRQRTFGLAFCIRPIENKWLMPAEDGVVGAALQEYGQTLEILGNHLPPVDSQRFVRVQSCMAGAKFRCVNSAYPATAQAG